MKTQVAGNTEGPWTEVARRVWAANVYKMYPPNIRIAQYIFISLEVLLNSCIFVCFYCAEGATRGECQRTKKPEVLFNRVVKRIHEFVLVTF